MTAEEWHPARTPEEVLARFPAITNAAPMDPRGSTQVRAIDRVEMLTVTAWADAAEVAAVLFDPARVPELAQRAEAAAAEFYARSGEKGDLHAETHDTAWNPHVKHEQGVARVWAVGTNHVDVIRDRWRNNPHRVQKPVEYFASMYGNRLPDYFDCDSYGCTNGDCGRACSVKLAKACSGLTRAMPVRRGTLILLFRMCIVCEELAGKMAANMRRTAVINARADLPSGTVIMPEPDPDEENPGAWA